jgi:hypothetical protein
MSTVNAFVSRQSRPARRNALVLALLATLSLSACGGDDEGGDEAVGAPEEMGTSAPSPGGDRSWGQVRGFSGRVRVLRGRSAAGSRRTALAGKTCKQALFLRPSAERRILHGKEAVPGSSPGEGLNTCKTGLFHNCRVPPDYGRLGGRVVEASRNSLHILASPASTEHLPDTEGVGEPGSRRAVR